MCSNGGTCVTGAGTPFICICPDGFSGETCNETETGKRFPWGYIKAELFSSLLALTGSWTLKIFFEKHSAALGLFHFTPLCFCLSYRALSPQPMQERCPLWVDRPPPPRWCLQYRLHLQVPAGLWRSSVPEQYVAVKLQLTGWIHSVSLCSV